MISDVTRIFDAYIVEMFADSPQVFKYLIGHERKRVCIERTCDEIQMCERKSWSIGWDVEKYRVVIRDMSKLFCMQALEHAEQAALSKAETARRITEAGRIDDIQAEFDEHEQQALHQKESSFLNDVNGKKDRQ